MKLFIGWSGETSCQVALTLWDWLPRFIPGVKPWMSSEDIMKGARWGLEIAAQLKKAKIGIICLTKENIESPWIFLKLELFRMPSENFCLHLSIWSKTDGN